ncbi:hypothetical protein [uncultured Fusobacterium sp.]|uniref:hypothetical protein n=1 Tax=uncultured Fusobacterium sp. TaxID=159267 RepID=UPI0015A55309|nr:hypothetical protein [uncultured Fusobacterium sp.]DAQ00474.1 MAG TPA: hypothetical protein [Caudoviricetes sp.]
MIKKRLEYFKRYFEEKNPRWRAFYKEDLPENISPKTIYFIITGEETVSKQKFIDFSIFYISSREKDGLLDFREEVLNFIKKDLFDEFETSNFFPTTGYRIKYSIDDERETMRIAEIQCTYDCTREILDEDKFIIINKLKDRIDLKE